MARVYQESCRSRKKHCRGNNSVSIFLFVYHLACRGMHNTTRDLRCDLFSHDVTRYELLMHNSTAVMDFFFLSGNWRLLFIRIHYRPRFACKQYRCRIDARYRCRNKIYLKHFWSYIFSKLQSSQPRSNYITNVTQISFIRVSICFFINFYKLVANTNAWQHEVHSCLRGSVANQAANRCRQLHPSIHPAARFSKFRSFAVSLLIRCTANGSQVGSLLFRALERFPHFISRNVRRSRYFCGIDIECCTASDMHIRFFIH